MIQDETAMLLNGGGTGGLQVRLKAPIMAATFSVNGHEPSIFNLYRHDILVLLPFSPQ
ncbi:MAG: hypothetical protein GPOALKHO_000919 [Sodalis sp.]|nr:MAG: hypothetical protein GPOALKHO_000919 [Sodalis sp.]